MCECLLIVIAEEKRDETMTQIGLKWKEIGLGKDPMK